MCLICFICRNIFYIFIYIHILKYMFPHIYTYECAHNYISQNMDVNFTRYIIYTLS